MNAEDCIGYKRPLSDARPQKYTLKGMRLVQSDCVGVPMDPPITTNMRTLDENNFPHTSVLQKKKTSTTN